MIKPIHLYKLDINPTTERHLLSLMQRHLKLSLEHGSCRTSSMRRAEISQQIEAIRIERDSIIASLRQAAELQVSR